MKDLSHIRLPGKMTVSGHFALMPQSDLDKLSDKDHVDEVERLMGLTTEEESDAGS